MSISRRNFIKGSLALPALLSGCNGIPSKLLGQKKKTIVFLTMTGGPSQFETFLYKPGLIKHHGKSVSYFQSETGQKGGIIHRPMYEMKQYGESGIWVSELFPHLAKKVDDLSFIHSMKSTSFNHGQAIKYMNTGTQINGHPYIGAWLDYHYKQKDSGIPTSYIFLDKNGYNQNLHGAWNTGHLPVHSPILISDSNEPIPYMSLDNISLNNQSAILEYMRKMRSHNKSSKRFELIEKSFSQKESLAKILNKDSFTKEETKLYGLNNKTTQSFGQQLVFTKRLIEKGAHYIQLFHGGESNTQNWDHHVNMYNHEQRAAEVDLPIAGFIQDLKQSGLYNDVIIVWGGEFGRLPVKDFSRKAKTQGRDHNIHSFTLFLTGGGIKSGYEYGKTDELGVMVDSNPVDYNDLHATLLHLTGINHKNLEYNHNGQQFRMTHKSSKIITDILA